MFQYPPGTLEVSPGMTESPSISAIGTAVSGAPVGIKRGAFMGSCKHRVWEAIRASSAAPYYLDDFSVGNICTLSYGFYFVQCRLSCFLEGLLISDVPQLPFLLLLPFFQMPIVGKMELL
jgi:hypothetical protein